MTKIIFLILTILVIIVAGCTSINPQTNTSIRKEISPSSIPTNSQATIDKPLDTSSSAPPAPPPSLSPEHLSYEKGLDLLKSGEYEDALREFNSTISLNKTNGNAYLARGKTYYQIGKEKYYSLDGEDAFRMAISDLSKAKTYYGDTDEIDNLIGWANYYTGAILTWKHWDYAEYSDPYFQSAVDNFSLAITKNSSKIESYQGRAEAYASIGSGSRNPNYPYNSTALNLAHKDIDEVEKLDPDNAYYWFLQGEIASIERMPNEILLKNYDKAVKKDKVGTPEFYRARGVIKLGTHDYDGALIDLKKAIELEPNFVLAYDNLRGYYSSQEKWDEATVSVQKAMNINSAIPGINTRYGISKLLSQSQGTGLTRTNVEEALKSMDKTIEMDPSDPDAHYWRYVFLVWLYRVPEAQEEARQYRLLAHTNDELKTAQYMEDVASDPMYYNLR